ncbi:ABC transporter substrate-binding protein [Deinococcus aestuarii]|uniref:ABC transporter substrate-binding protein n=1 Tax=Deinococcus aestuarii TaxID=2774531 RepID=UPI001C0BCAA3|nr:extracellular solute-binding protein [Deinococcus aestuarii]
MKRLVPCLTLTALLAGPAAAQGTPRTDPAKGNPAVSGTLTWLTNAPDLARPLVPSFQKVYPNVKLTVLAVPLGDLRTKITTLASANQTPADVMNVDARDLEFLARRFPNYLTDLTPWAKKYQGGFPAAYVREGTVNGKVYGLPVVNGANALWYRTDMFKKAGVNVSSIRTWDDFIAAGAKVQAANPGVKLIHWNAFGDDELSNVLFQQATGGYYFDANGDIAINTPGAQKAFTTLKRMWDGGLILNATSVDTMIGALNANRLATFALPDFWADVLPLIAPGQKGLWATAPLPGFGKPQSVDRGTTYIVVTKGSKNQAAAQAFAEWYATSGAQLRGEKVGKINAYLPGSDKVNLRNPYFASPNWASPFILGVKNVPYQRYTSDAEAARQAVIAATGSILNGTAIPAALSKAERDLANQTGRSVAR